MSRAVLERGLAAQALHDLHLVLAPSQVDAGAEIHPIRGLAARAQQIGRGGDCHVRGHHHLDAPVGPAVPGLRELDGLTKLRLA